MDIRQTLGEFDAFLTKANLHFSGVLIGGAALVLLDIVSRATKDFDLLNDEIFPREVEAAAKEFALQKNLPEDWLNTGPSSLKRDLPAGWEGRTKILFNGKAIELKTLGRSDFLKTKIWALCDRTRDLDDVKAMNPSERELQEVKEWLIPLDANKDWPQHVEEVLAVVREERQSAKA